MPQVSWRACECASFTAGDGAEALTLQGWSRIAALASLEALLVSVRQQSTPEALEAFLTKGGRVKNMSAKTIAKSLRCYRRVMAVGDHEHLLLAKFRDLDERYGSQHVFGTLAGVDLLCSRTLAPRCPFWLDCPIE